MDERHTTGHVRTPRPKENRKPATSPDEARRRFDDALNALVTEGRFELLPDDWSEIDVLEWATGQTLKP